MSDIQTTNWSETASDNDADTPNGWPEGQDANTVNDCARELMGALKREWNRDHPTVTSSGTNTVTLTYTTAPPALVQGMRFSFIAGGTNTGAVTLNVNSLGAVAVKKGAAGGTALAAGDITSGGVYAVHYDGTNFQLLNPGTLFDAGTGSVTSVNLTAPSAGITVSGGPITSSGSITLALANDLAALEGLSSTGIAVRTTTDTWAQRSVAAGTGISVTNGSGVSGNPTVAIDTAVVPQKNAATSYSGQQYFPPASLTDGTTISWDCTNQVVKVTLGGSRTMAAPSNVQEGAVYLLAVTQDATGSRTLSWNAKFDFGTDGAPTLTTTASKTDILSFEGGSSSTLRFLGIKKGFAE